MKYAYAEEAPEVLRKAQDDVAARRHLLETGKIRLIPEPDPPAPSQERHGAAGDKPEPTTK